jgi:hypothetical protein
VGRIDRARVLIVAVIGALLTGCSAAIDPAAIADAQTAARVKTALVNDPEIGGFAIEVRVARGVVTLSGRVRTQEQVGRAVDLVRTVPGVSRVEPTLQVGPELPFEAVVPRDPPGSRDPRVFEERDLGRGLLALGASLGWSVPNPESLKTRVSISPLIKVGSPRGLGPTMAFDWFHADLESVGGAATLTRVHVKPLMGGIGYTVGAGRVSFAPSVVAGYAFNSLTVTDRGVVQGLPVEVGNSFVWRVGASAWYDVSRRFAFNASMGYLMTGLRLTVLAGDTLERIDASGDTTILHLGIAYRVF